MNLQETFYHSTAQRIENSEKSQFFGKPCYKINKKAFCAFFKDCMVFKLKAASESHSKALSLDGSELFDPSGKNRPMKEWVQVPYHYKDLWLEFAEAAKSYVDSK